MKLYGPFEVEIIIYVTDGDQIAKATYNLGKSKPPTSDNIQAALEKTETQIKEQMGGNWHLCTKQEYFDEIMREATGTTERFALPGGDDWDVLEPPCPKTETEGI